MKNRFFVFFIILMSTPTVIWLFQPGFFQSDDGEWMIIRFSAFHQALADGQFPVRFLGRLNHEFGYPVANFLYPGFMYLAEPIHLLGFGFVDSIKIVLGLSMVGSAVFCYLWLAKFFDRWAASLGSLLYLYMPYHLYDLYKRGSVGEVLAIAVLPFIFWMIEKRNFFFASLGIAMLILSHNTLAALFLPVVVIYMYVRKVSSIKYQVLSIFFGLATSAFFWIPALLDLQYTRFSQTVVSNWQDHFADIKVVGLATIIILIAFIVMRKRSRESIFFFLLGGASVFLSLPISTPVWQVLPSSFVQFPFRFLSLLLPSVAFLSAYTVSSLKGQTKLFIGLVLLILLAISSTPYLRPAELFDKGDSYYATNEDTTNVQNEYMPKWVKLIPTSRPKMSAELDSGEITNLSIRPNSVSLEARADVQTELRINKVFFPGWRLFVDNVQAPIFYDNDKGIITFPAYPGTHKYEAKFSEFATSQLADIISVAGFIGLAFISRKKYNKK